MDGHRIYGKKISIKTDNVQHFYNKRAAMVEEKGWGAVSLGDEDSSIAARVYDYDRDTLLPKLDITSKSRVLELGCGMGRWAKIVLPHCGAYYGVDFSEKMLLQAEKICSTYSSRCKFFHMSALDAVKKDAESYGGKFDCIIMSGVCMYINDGELAQVFQQIPQLSSEHCVILLKEPVATSERLTLNEFQSVELKSTYDAIYRTAEEYGLLFRPLKEAGFSICEQYFLPEEVGRKRLETNGWCTIFKRNA